MHSSTKSNLLVASCYAGILALGMIVGPKFGRESHSASASYFPRVSGKSEKVDQVLDIIQENYVDPVKVDTLQNLAINQILSHLDPHSSYLPPVKAQEQSQSLEGNYTGIGIEYFMLNDTILVSAVKSGPAARAGLRAGDRILRIGKKQVAGKKVTSAEIISLIKGRQGSSVDLLIRPRGQADEKQVSVKRDRITVSSIDAAYMLSPGVGYIKISRFGARTDADFATEVARLQQNDMSSLVLDLRHNGGGYLSAATALADEFLPEKQLIVYTKGEHEPRTDYFATAKGKFESGKLVVLIDETTASASEVVAGAIQDLDRGVVIGRRSFGKGLVQEQFNFGDGSALNLTIARYYTPLGRSIQRPYKMPTAQYFNEVSKRLENEEAKTRRDSMYKTSASYRTASGRLLYDGGGIMPDVHVPVDTSAFNAFYYAMRARGILTEFVFERLIDKYHFSNLPQLLHDFNLSDDDYKALVSLAVKGGVSVSTKQASIARAAVSAEVKAILARVYFGDQAYFVAQNEKDTAIAKALQELKQP